MFGVAEVQREQPFGGIGLGNRRARGCRARTCAGAATRGWLAQRRAVTSVAPGGCAAACGSPLSKQIMALLAGVELQPDALFVGGEHLLDTAVRATVSLDFGPHRGEGQCIKVHGSNSFHNR
jgi:hypothetical protein